MWCAEISCNKNLIGKIPIKMCEDRAKSWEPASQQSRGGGGWWMGSVLLTTVLPPPQKYILASCILSHSPSFLNKCCFNLAHGSAPSNSWVSQSKSYFLIHSLSHIIILLAGISEFFFQAFFSSTACSVLRVTSQPQWDKDIQVCTEWFTGQAAPTCSHILNGYLYWHCFKPDVILWNL